MRAAFLTDDWVKDPRTAQYVTNGAAYYRAELPAACIPGAVVGRPRFNPKDGFGVDDGAHGLFGFDTVLLKLLMDAWVPKQIEKARALGQRVIVDVDDHFEQLDPSNRAYAATSPANPVRNREHYRASILAADTIVVSTPTLQDWYQRFHRDVRLVRNAVNPADFDIHPVTTRRPVIGWMGAVDWRSRDLETLTAWLPDLLEDHDLMFHHSGHHPGTRPIWEIIGLPIDRVIVRRMVPRNRIRELMCFDIGMVPLSDVPFNRAKSNLKGLEYAAAGIPFVAQALPEYLHLVAGRCAITPDDWYDQVTALLDPGQRRQEAAANRTVVTTMHTIAQRADQWRAVFDA